jgi:hypothetical protein
MMMMTLSYFYGKRAKCINEAVELDGPAVSALRRAISEVKQRWSVIEWVTKNLFLSFSRASPCFRRYVKQLVPAAFAVVSIHQRGLVPPSADLARVVGYSLFTLCV